jgi:hypothetical protein
MDFDQSQRNPNKMDISIFLPLNKDKEFLGSSDCKGYIKEY